MRIWLCEKPSQGRDIARVLGVRAGARTDGYIETDQGCVTWAVGHLLEQAAPDDYDPALAKWRLDTLPIIPPVWKTVRSKGAAKQLQVVERLLRKATDVVIATDADREGETIARELLDAFRVRTPVYRLWLSALDDKSIRTALARLLPGDKTEPLHWAAQGRARADWLVGMNLTRAITLLWRQRTGAGDTLSVGRVQTPTLALIVRRDREIECFVPRGFFEIGALVEADGKQFMLRHAPAAYPEDRRIYERERAESLAAAANGARGPLEVTTRRRHEAPPPLFSLSKLQQAANRQWGWSADRTLKTAQALYEQHKLTSYPRTDCPFLPAEQASEIPTIVGHLAKQSELAPAVARLESPQVRSSVWNSSKVTAHHAIVPTSVAADLSRLSDDERKAYLLIARHYLANVFPDSEYDETRIKLDANGVPLTAVGKVPRVAGWRVVFGATFHGDDAGEDTVVLPVVANGAAAVVLRADVEGKQTQPPKPYTEGTLLADMEAVSKFATDPAIKARLKESSGLGTEATRASIIKLLFKRGFVESKGKAIRSTPIGRSLIDALPPVVCDAALTALWEGQLDEIASGELDESARDAFVDSVAAHTRALIDRMRQEAPAAAPIARAPTAKMVALANSYAEQIGLARLPPGVEDQYDACAEFLDRNKGEVQAQRVVGRPSDKQAAWAREIALQRGVALPDEALSDRTACSQFIERYRRSA